jgi:hypothetical protein
MLFSRTKRFLHCLVLLSENFFPKMSICNKKMSEASLFTRLNGNGISKKIGDAANTKTIIIGVLVVFVLILIGWAIWKSMKSSSSSTPMQTSSPNLRAVVSPVMPTRSPAPKMQAATPQVSNEKVKVVKVNGSPSEPYDTAGLGEDTVSDPDFLMGIGKDSMADVTNAKKTIDDMQYSSPQDLLGIDSVLQADALVQAEDKSKTASIGIINPHTVTPRNLTTGVDFIRGDLTIAPQANQSVVGQSVSSSTSVHSGWAGLDDVLSQVSS